MFVKLTYSQCGKRSISNFIQRAVKIFYVVSDSCCLSASWTSSYGFFAFQAMSFLNDLMATGLPIAKPMMVTDTPT